jgi:hypothetical protein
MSNPRPAPRTIFELADLLDEHDNIVVALSTNPDLTSLPTWARELWAKLRNQHIAFDSTVGELYIRLDEAMRAARPGLPAGWAVWTDDGRLLGLAAADPRHRDGWESVSSDPADAAAMQAHGCTLDPLDDEAFDVLTGDGYGEPGSRDRFLNGRTNKPGEGARP